MDERTGTTAGEWLTIAAVTERSEASRMTVHRAAKRGELPYAKLSGTRYFHADDVDAWAQTRREVAA